MKLCMFQHSNLQRMIQEEISGIQGLENGDASMLQQAVIEVKALEELLVQHEARREAKLRSLTTRVEEEVLQTRVVPMEEVKQNIEQWTPAFAKECMALTDGPVKPVTPAEVQRMRDSGEVVEVLPMLAIASRKPPNRYKGRVVVCGNYAETKPEGSISVGGVCSTAIRAVVHLSTAKQWSLGTLDVTGAFLQAPRRPHGKTTLAQPPSILQQMNLVQPGELWKIECALYGLQESPSDWAAHRDEGARKMKWMHQGQQRHLEETAEKHLWKIKSDDGVTCGYMLVYVDDFLIASELGEMKSLMEEIKRTWVCSEEEIVSTTSTTRFCGYELQERLGGGFWLGQTGYLNDVLTKHQVEGQEKHPCPRIEEAEDEPPSAQATKEAQMMVGEALWVANRTRPDILYATGVISRLLHRRPRYACFLGKHLLRFLSGTRNQGLEYKPWTEVQEEPDDHLPHERGWNTLEVYSDVSYGPPHEQYRSVQGVLVEHQGCPIMWESTRQGFVVQSTAEAELIGYSEAYTAGESVASLLEVLEIPTKRHLLGDNKAALSLCLNESGPWRTRHLRLRIAHIRSILQRHEAQWNAAHLRGSRLVADGLTKPLAGQAFVAFAKLLHIGELGGSKATAKVARCNLRKQVSPTNSWKVAVGSLLVSGALLAHSELSGLGSLVVVCALALWKWWETRSSKANEQRPQQDLEKKRERGNQFEGSDGAAHPPQSSRMDTAEKERVRSVGRVAVDGTIPRVCAVRKKSSHDDSHGDQQQSDRSSARARGVQAMRSLDGAAAAVRVDVEVASLTEDLQVTLQLGKGDERRSARWSENLATETTYEQSAPEAAGTRSGGQSLREMTTGGYGKPSETAKASSSNRESSLHEASRSTTTAAEKPWLRSEFQSVQSSSKDLWNMSVPGWAIRVHRHPRKRMFHPIHRSTPFNAASLEEVRVTHCIVQSKPVTAVDEWTDPKKDGTISGVAADSEWRGYTFFKFKSTTSDVSSSTKGTVTEPLKKEESDGYEIIDEEDSG